MGNNVQITLEWSLEKKKKGKKNKAGLGSYWLQNMSLMSNTKRTDVIVNLMLP